MAKTSTYSFGDVTATLNFAGIIPYSITGEGTGSIDITMATEKTSHDIAADGSVMVSKILGDNGSVAISLQQTSTAHKMLLLWYNYLKAASSSEWANNSMVIRNNVYGETIVCTGVSPQNKPGISFQAQGQKVTWTLMAADIQHLPA